MSAHSKETMFELFIEYVLITLPILIYVGIEAIHHNDYMYLITSPEWSVATMFLLLQTFRLQNRGAATNISKSLGEFIVILLLLFAIAASINMFISMGQHELAWGAIIIRWTLFVVASILFVYIAGAAIYAKGDDK